MRKRWIALLLALTMLLGILPVSALAAGDLPFTDVKESDWFYNGVRYVYENGLMNGTGDTAFSPDTVTSRGMIVTILHRMEGEPAAAGEVFADVEAGRFYTAAVAWASANGIVGGYGDGTFGPNDPITREQLAAILYRYAKYKGMDVSVGEDTNILSYTDFDQLSEWAIPAVQWACGAGLISGVGGGALDPQGHATRAQTATILMRFCEPEPTEETGDKGGSDPATVPEAPDSASYTVTFDSNGGSEVGQQTVAAGQTAAEPDEPTKENCVFIGWYLADGYSGVYDFSQAVHANLTLHAKWFDETDDTDSDGDGLTDALEREFGTDPSKPDTDEDGIPDYVELDWLNYNPTSSDTDQDGTPDAEEDPDGDGLTNLEEVRLGTNPIYWDSDSDHLSDYDEVYVYHTDPLKEDTDSDGVSDGTEVEIGSNPRVAERTFETAAASGTVDEHTTVAASAEVVTDAAGAGTLRVQALTPLDNPLLSQSIAGYLGEAYDFSTDGTFVSAEITFYYDKALGTIGPDFQPRIYYFNEETGLLEELPEQDVKDGSVSVTVSHFSTYILLNKVEFDKVWDTEIKTPQNQADPQYTGIDVVFVIDSSGSMTSNDRNGLRKDAAKAFVAKLGTNDRAAVVDFDSAAAVYQNFTSDHASLDAAIDRINSSGGTSLSAGMSAAINLFTNSSYTRTDAYKYIIFLTDGNGSYSTGYTTTANNHQIVVYTIGLGSGVNESVLKAIAAGTGGKYYFASTADALSDIYVEVSFETVDYTTDSNNDGISDYYTKLLNDGILPISTGCFDLVDVTEMYGEDCDDWDGDGLKNGEEIQICVTGNQVYVKMESHPLLVDSDGDGYSDAMEKKLGTPPMKYTSDAYSSLTTLEADDRYVYIDVANDRGILASINAFFDWKKTDEAKEQLIDYFYDYASKETIDKNQEQIAKLKAREEYLKYAQSLANILKTAKNIYNTCDDLSGMVEGMSDTGNAKDFIDKARDKNIQLKGASAQLRASRKRILDAMNTDQMSGQDVLKTVITDVDKALSAMEDCDSLFKEYDPASFAKDLTTQWATVTSCIAAGVGTIKTCYDGFRYMKLDTGFKTISKGYKDFLKQKGTTSTSTYIGVAMDVVDGGLEIWENCNTYGKMKANRDAYISYIELLYYITEHAEDKYDRVAADAIAQIVQDESWDTYDRQLTEANAKTVALTTFSIVLDVCPYTKVAKSAYDLAKLAISVTGLSNNAQLIVSCRTMQSVSDGCIYIIDSSIEKNGSGFFSYGPDALMYMTQLAQCRLAGENFAKQRLMKGDLAALVSRWLTSTSKEEIEDMFRTISGGIYSNAARLKLELSDQLPYYSEFVSS